jgi:alkyl hydroperoxide reductase subunit AhpC
VIALNVDPIADHLRWLDDIEAIHGREVEYPIISDPDLVVANRYDIAHPDSLGSGAVARKVTTRSVFIIGPDRLVKAILVYPANTGRNFDEVLRLQDSLQLNVRLELATPVNWKPGKDVVVPLRFRTTKPPASTRRAC